MLALAQAFNAADDGQGWYSAPLALLIWFHRHTDMFKLILKFGLIMLISIIIKRLQEEHEVV